MLNILIGVNNTAVAADMNFLGPLPSGVGDNVLSNLISTVYQIAGIVAVGMVAYSGIKYMLSNGNPSKSAEATQSLINSLAGLAVIMLAGAIVGFVIGKIGSSDNLMAIAGNAIRQIFFFAGVLAVIMIVFAGIRYITAHGDAAQAKAATNTLIYAIVGLAVSLMAYAIVGFVIGKIG